MMQLLMTIKSPKDSLYLGLKIECLISIPSEYPFKPPMFRCITPIRHMLVSSTTGALYIGILEINAWSPGISLAEVAKDAEEYLFQTPTRDQVDIAARYILNPEMLDVARRSLDEYSAMVKHQSQAIINKEVPMRSIW